jgi:hypothetical protein
MGGQELRKSRGVLLDVIKSTDKSWIHIMRLSLIMTRTVCKFNAIKFEQA